jgi:hypothetical protein
MTINKTPSTIAKTFFWIIWGLAIIVLLGMVALTISFFSNSLPLAAITLLATLVAGYFVFAAYKYYEEQLISKAILWASITGLIIPLIVFGGCVAIITQFNNSH